jgi:hypothetical protein
MRARLLLLATVFAALIAVAPAGAAERFFERGIVQSIDPTGVVLRALDGTQTTVALGPETRFRLNGRAATLAEIRPGFVAEAVSGASGPAIVLRAFGRADRQVERGVIVRAAQGGLLLRRGPGDRIRIGMTDRTAVWRGGSRVRLRALRAGLQVEVVLAANGTARVILIQRAARVT